jgi:hypothetical protein
MKGLVPLVAALLLAGCGGDDESTTTPTSGTLVTYARTGGFASMPEGLVVEADGAATVEAGVDPARETFELDEDELQQLRTELEVADLGRFDEPDEPSGCADCYVYEIGSGDDTISYDESQEVPDAITALVAHLSRITAEHYPEDATEPPIVN